MNAATFSFNKRYCVPNSAGPAKQNDSTARCWDIAQANLDTNGRPAFNPRARAGAARCARASSPTSATTPTAATSPATAPSPTDRSIRSGYVQGTLRAPGLQGHGAGGARARRRSASGGTTAPGRATAPTPAGTRWASSSSDAVAGATNLFRFSSAPHSVYGNFFPLDPPANAFPIYTLTGSFTGRERFAGCRRPGASRCCATSGLTGTARRQFGAGAGCIGDQYVFPPSFAMGIDPAVWFGMHLNGDWLVKSQGWFHDSWFSVEARDLFVFNGRIRSAVLRRRRHVRLHQRRPGDRSRRRPPAAARQGARRRSAATPRPRRAARSTCPAPIRSARPPLSGHPGRLRPWRPGAVHAVRTRSSRSRSSRSTPPAPAAPATAASAPCRWICKRAAPTRSPSSAATATRPNRTSSSR